MSGSVSLSTLRTKVRKRADVEGETVRHTNAEINGYINEAWNELYEELAGTNEEYFSTTYSFTTTPGTALYTLPAAFFYLRTASVNQNGWRYEITRLDLNELDEQENFGVSYTGSPIGYTILGDNLELVPTPTAAFTVTIRYVPLPTDFSADGDTQNFRAGWEEFVIWEAAAKVIAVDGRDHTVARTEADRQRARIIASAQKRNLHQPKHFLRRDVTHRFRRRLF